MTDEKDPRHDDRNHRKLSHTGSVVITQEEERKHLKLHHQDSDVKEHDCRRVDLITDFAGHVNVKDVVLVHQMLQSHVKET
jgi:hypothetical protein